MKSPVFLQIAILALLGMASAMSLLFFKSGDNCYETITDHLGCFDKNEQNCCHVADPFCVTAGLFDSDGYTHTTYFTNGSGCSISDQLQNYARCITSDKCCLHLPIGLDSHECSAFWHWGEPNPDPNNDPGEWPGEDGRTVAERPCSQPNFLAYNDGFGLRKMLIPDGKFDHVMEMYSKRDFGALGRYETFEGGGD